MNNTLNSVFEVDETYENSQWLKVKIRTFAFGRNRNGSDILNSSLTNFSKAKKTVGAIPIVAKYNDDTDNLEGHNVSMRKNKNGDYDIFHDTDALGFTSPTANFYLEEVNEGDETVYDYKTYVVIEDVYLWKRFDATKKIIEWFKEGIVPRVSMEIDEVEGMFDRDGYFQIHDFVFTGIAALGTDVEPCFPRAEIQMYTVNEFREELKNLMTELNYSTQEGGKEMPTENEEKVVKDYEKTEVEFDQAETVDATETDASEVEVVEENEIIEEASSDNPDNSTETPDTFEDESTTVDTEEVTEKDEEADEEEVEPSVDYEAKYNDAQGKLDELEINYAKLQTQLDELQTYKRNVEETKLKDKFEGKLSDEEFTQVFTDMKDSELDKVEEKLYALIGKKNFSIQTTTKTNTNKVTILSPKEDVKPFGGFFD